MSSSADNVRILFLTLVIFSTCSGTWQQPILSRSTYKGLNGVAPTVYVFDSGFNRAVYFYDQTVAVVDINKKNEMLNCDIIEVYEPSEATEVLGNLSKTVLPSEVTFNQMINLMQRCEILDLMQRYDLKEKSHPKGALERANVFGTNALNLLSGILPGTKWCGTGDLAENYHDLGTEIEIDRCCRTHDLCPVKIRGQRSRYNLTNYSLYSKSHCDCDGAFYKCLKKVGNTQSSIMGKLYFNIVKVGCIEDLPERSNDLSMATISRRFASPRLSY